MNKQVKRRVKVNRDIRDLVRKLKINRLDKERYTYFLSLAYKHLSSEKKTYLHSDFIKSKLGNEYLEDLKYLEKLNLISRGTTFEMGKRSKNFSIQDMKNFSSVKVDMRIDIEVLLKMKKKYVFNDFPEVELNQQNLSRLTLKSDQLTSDYQHKMENHLNSEDSVQFFLLLNSLNKTQKKVTKKFEGSRLYHSIVASKKGHRYLLLADEEELEEIDMSSAHFFFLWKNLSLKRVFSNHILKKELLKFKKIVTEGILYKFISDSVISSFIGRKSFTKEKIKKKLITYLYLRPEKYWKLNKSGKKRLFSPIYEVFEVMKKEFPNIHNYIINISGSRLVEDLTYFESTLMLRRFAQIVKSKYKNLFYLNIHDAVLYKKNDKAKILEILSLVFKDDMPFFKNEDLKNAFQELNEKTKLKKVKVKNIEPKTVYTLKVKCKNGIFIKASEITKENFTYDSKADTIKKISQVLALERPTTLKKMHFAEVQKSIIQYRDEVGRNNFQIKIFET